MNLLLAASALALGTTVQNAHGHDDQPQLGKVVFEASCNADAETLLRTGLSWLHSFEYEQAARTFSEAAAADPNCGIAHWGVAMSYYHPLWAPPSPTELEKGRAALATAESVGSASQREQDYIAALYAFYRDSEKVDHKTRVLAHAAAMEQLHRHYPADREAAVFYALSLIAAGLQDSDPDFAQEQKAGAILNAVFEQEPDHPGVAHYLIHSFDYPPLAHFALPAAQRYADIAPDSAHAQHMPSHIFVRLGQWQDAIRSNVKAEAAARAYAQANGLADSWDERVHAMDYLAYGYLQTGQDVEAERVLNALNEIRRVDPPNFKVAYAATAIPVRLVLERGRWREAAALELPANVRTLAPLKNFQWAEAHIHFARAVGAARGGDAAVAKVEVAKLREVEQGLEVPPGTYDWRTQVTIERQIAEAWLANAEGREDDALSAMREAADLDDASEKHPVTPGAILPAREQLGELLLELGRPAEALAEFEAALERAPGRLAGLYGAARAAKLAGDAGSAQAYYTQLARLTRDGDGTRTEVKEARAFVGTRSIR